MDLEVLGRFRAGVLAEDGALREDGAVRLVITSGNEVRGSLSRFGQRK